ncbi:MAG: hypothetical protein J0H41_19555 [Rhizobiales bacterium]|nr:hypothetical protein [Hyphomicrobiales bacterium]
MSQNRFLPGLSAVALRVAAFLLASAQAVYWLWTVQLVVRSGGGAGPDDMIPLFFATPPFLAVTAPALALSAVGLAPRLAFWLAATGAVLTPLVGWQALLFR